MSTRPAGERVGVVVRVRPQPGADAGRQPAVRVDPDDTRRVQVLSAVDAAASKEVPSEQNAYGAVATRQGARSFRFDACLEGSATQDAMYSACDMSALVQAALAGAEEGEREAEAERQCVHVCQLRHQLTQHRR